MLPLPWILKSSFNGSFADSISTKSVFTHNRAKDIALFKKSLLQDYGITIQFRYVKSEDNPCDLHMRGLSFNEFVKRLSFWQHGPQWLPDSRDSWPDSALGCLSAASKSLVATGSSINATFNVDVVMSAEPLADVERFSSFGKAVRATTLVVKAIFRMRKSREDPGSSARFHLLQHMQRD